MNLFILLSALLLHPGNYTDTSSIYQLQFAGIDSNTIDMSSYVGKHIILYEFDAVHPDKTQMTSLDTLYKQNSNNLAVIAIPVKDFDSADISKDGLKSLLRDSFQVSYPVTDISLAKKAATTQQHPLLGWVTHLEKNNHFDDEIAEDGYMFVISDRGVLYSIVKKEISPTSPIMQQVLSNQPNE
jgi:glutathione peroxidase-family protein